MIDLNRIPISADKTKPASAPRLDFLNKEISLFSNRKFQDKVKEKFYGELSVLLSAGLDIRSALELLITEVEKEREKAVLRSILDAIISGATLPEALLKTEMFTPYEYYSLKIGEESGRMKDVLTDLSKYYSKKIKQKRKVRSALSYPVIVMIVAFGAVFFMLRFVVPMFAEMLQRFGSELPPLTKAIISASDWLSQYGLFILLVITAIAAFVYANRRQLWFRKYSSALILKLPLIGPSVQKVYIERLSHSMQLMLSAKTGLLKSLELCSKMIGYYPIESSLAVIQKKITNGESLHQCMSEFPIYPQRVISLVRVGEEVNKLDDMFLKISEQLSAEIEHDTSVLSSIIEPVMIMFLGVMVAVILIAMYLPMFRIGSAFG
jgi:type IV pilus assembly protein PilC